MLTNLKDWLTRSLRSLMETRPGQIPALDGLRTIAITLVIAGYSKNDLVHAGAEQTPFWLFGGLAYGWTGVDLFFVLSGFLIGRILFTEVKKTGTVKVGEFLIKRGMRIWPLYYFMCALILTKLALLNQMPQASVIPDLLFVNNFFHRELIIFGSWSLSVEEQFYLLASILILSARGLVRTQAGKISHFLVFLFCAVPLARSLVWNFYASRGMDLNFLEWEVVHAYIFTHCDGLLIGLLFASLVVFRPALAVARSWVTPALYVATFAAAALTFADKVLFKYTFVSLVFGLMVWRAVVNPDSVFARLLSWKYFQIFSRLSYGMYIWYRIPLWHIASKTRQYLPDVAPGIQWIVVFGICFTLAMLLAAVTYILVERPFLQLRDQYFSRKRREIEVGGPVPSGALVMESVRE